MSQTSNFVSMAREEMETVLKLMGVDAQIEAYDEADEIYLHIESPDAGRLIGKGAYGLEALQYIINRMLCRKYPDIPHMRLDIERYRERRKDKLGQEALDAVECVLDSGRPYRFKPLHAFERRIVHQLLKDREDVNTVSEAIEGDRRKTLVVRLAAED